MTDTVTVPIAAEPVEAPAAGVPLLNDRGDGRNARGLFAPGNRLSPGRPRGIDVKALVQEEAERTGFDMRAAWWNVVRKLFLLAESGDVQAAKLLFDRLALPEDIGPGALSLCVVTGVDSNGAPATGIGLRVAGTQQQEGDA